jgi:hypothetical protein
MEAKEGITATDLLKARPREDGDEAVLAADATGERGNERVRCGA